jgi:hypothetical protein
MMSLAAWTEVERKVGRPPAQVFDLMIGTSVGGILTGVFGRGIPTDVALPMFRKVIPQAFKRRGIYPRYSRKALTRALIDNIGLDTRMSELATRVIITSVNARDKRNHFFKSWQNGDGHLPVVECVTRTYAAPMYFGKWRTPGTKQVWLDGGTGSMNVPIVAGIWEAMRQGWVGHEDVHVLCVGTGYHPEITGWDKLRRMRLFREIAMFMDPRDGGMARYQARQDNVRAAEDLAGAVPGFSFQIVDRELPKKMDCIDGVRYMDKYETLGRQMGSEVDVGMLR